VKQQNTTYSYWCRWLRGRAGILGGALVTAVANESRDVFKKPGKKIVQPAICITWNVHSFMVHNHGHRQTENLPRGRAGTLGHRCRRRRMLNKGPQVSTKSRFTDAALYYRVSQNTFWIQFSQYFVEWHARPRLTLAFEIYWPRKLS
jgi:hypothetical protein